MKTKYVCGVCGSDNISVQAWVDPNTKAIDDFVGGGLDRECFCNNCDTTTHWELERFMKIGQKVFCDDSTQDYGVITLINGEAEDAWVCDDDIVLVDMINGVSENEIFAGHVEIVNELN